MTALPEKILFVDDDENILHSLKRQLRGKANVYTAQSGEEGLHLLQQEGPFAVVTSDMRMPKMDGVEFLSQVRKQSPNSVRILLTGQADMQSAIDVVNSGQIFRFLTKPCPTNVMAEALVSSIKQYRQINAEKVLLEKTLFRTVKVLTEILSMTNPKVFSQGVRIKRYVIHIIEQLNLEYNWDLKVAAMLSSLSHINISDEILDKLFSGQELSVEEGVYHSESQQVIMRSLHQIPRLESVVKMLEPGEEAFRLTKDINQLDDHERCILGRHIIKLARYIDQQVNSGRSFDSIIDRLINKPGYFDPTIVYTLKNMKLEGEGEIAYLNVSQLSVGMILHEDILTPNEMVLLSKGHEITEPILMKLIRYSHSSAIREPVKVIRQTDIAEGNTDCE